MWRNAWALVLPLMFLPNFVDGATSLGSFDTSDLVLFPYLGLLLFAQRGAPPLRRRVVQLVMALFWIAFVSTMTVSLRFDYHDTYFVRLGLVKLAKLSLYGLAGVLTARARTVDGARPWFTAALLLSASVATCALYLDTDDSSGLRPWSPSTPATFESKNAVSVALALGIAFLGAEVLLRRSRGFVDRTARLLTPVFIAGLLISTGRGGWIAAAVAAVYVAYRARDRGRLWLWIVLASGLVILAYFYLEPFQYELTRFVDPGDAYVRRYGLVMGVSDSGRLENWASEAARLLDYPVLGFGLFHRNPLANGLRPTGSHNFFLQMALELGLIAGVLMIAMARQVWRAARASSEAVAIRAVLVAAVVAGAGGEYFYGGPTLLLLISLCGPALIQSSPPARSPAGPPVRTPTIPFRRRSHALATTNR